jgi:hypothetical protein
MLPGGCLTSPGNVNTCESFVLICSFHLLPEAPREEASRWSFQSIHSSAPMNELEFVARLLLLAVPIEPGDLRSPRAMIVNGCPSGVASAPRHRVWEVLTTPERSGEWLDAKVVAPRCSQ